MANSLLTNGSQSCSGGTDCVTAPITPTTGSLSIEATRPDITTNMEDSDIVEISGTCIDLGKKKNRIFVEVFAGEQDESAPPYITNEIESNCHHPSGAAGMITSSGLSSSNKCFWITKGIGLIEEAGLPSQKDFPQCHNGQFGFAVRLGKILTDATLGQNYLVRMRLRTEDGGISDSPPARIKITRQLTPPKVLSTVVNASRNSCIIEPAVSRFNMNSWYDMYRGFKLSDGSDSIPVKIVPVAATLPSPPGFPGEIGYINQQGKNLDAYSYEDFYRVEGVTYNYTVDVTEHLYFPLYAPTVPTAVSNKLTCKMPNPIIYISPKTPVSTTCSISAAAFNKADIKVKYQVGYVLNRPGWTKESGVLPTTINCTAGGLDTSCDISGLSPAVMYIFAVRSYRDTVAPFGAPNLGVEEVGEWSNEINCRPPP